MNRFVEGPVLNSNSSSSSSSSSSSQQFWKPGTIAPGVNIDRTTDDDNNDDIVVYNEFHNLSLRQQRMVLPAYASRREILYAVEMYSTVVLVGETGSGKSTQVPQYLHEAGWTAGNRCVACTQPRRVGAVTVATRVADEMGVKLGAEVGYSVRFDDNSDTHRTRIKYLTDGMLIRETMNDPLLSKYSVIMLDEAHERSLETDILFGLMKKIQRQRRDLRLIISSATLDAHVFQRFFSNTNSHSSSSSSVIVCVEGRQFPVDILYTKYAVRDYIAATIDTVCYIRTSNSSTSGDILAFLTGRDEIERVVQQINNMGDASLRAYPLYAGLSSEQQLRSLQPAARGIRKVVVATNIAETSVTIPNVAYVIDCGFVKMPAYSHHHAAVNGGATLTAMPVSQAAANQRAGRAGRVRAGTCFRLYREVDFNELPMRTLPEIQRCDLTSMVLQLKALGIDDILHFDFLSPPPVPLMVRALELLHSVGAIDDECRLTQPVGAMMAEFPCDPKLTKMLLASRDHHCSEDMLTIAAMLSVQNVFVQPRSVHASQRAQAARRTFVVADGDHLTYLNVFNQYLLNGKDAQWCHDNFLNHRALRRACDIRRQLRRLMVRFRIPMEMATADTGVDAIRRCVVAGYFANAAQIQSDGTFRTVRGDQVLHLHPSSVLYGGSNMIRWIVYHDVVETSKVYMRDVTRIEPQWLAELAPNYYQYRGAGTYDDDDDDGKAIATGGGGGVLNEEIIQEDGREVKHRRIF